MRRVFYSSLLVVVVAATIGAIPRDGDAAALASVSVSLRVDQRVCIPFVLCTPAAYSVELTSSHSPCVSDRPVTIFRRRGSGLQRVAQIRTGGSGLGRKDLPGNPHTGNYVAKVPRNTSLGCAEGENNAYFESPEEPATQVGLDTSPGGPLISPSFNIDLSSTNSECLTARSVSLYRKGRGGPKRVAKGITFSDGSLHFAVTEFRDGVYYATTPKAKRAGGVLCLAGRSADLSIDT